MVLAELRDKKGPAGVDDGDVLSRFCTFVVSCELSWRKDFLGPAESGQRHPAKKRRIHNAIRWGRVTGGPRRWDTKVESSPSWLLVILEAHIYIYTYTHGCRLSTGFVYFMINGFARQKRGVGEIGVTRFSGRRGLWSHFFVGFFLAFHVELWITGWRELEEGIRMFNGFVCHWS